MSVGNITTRFNLFLHVTHYLGNTLSKIFFKKSYQDSKYAIECGLPHEAPLNTEIVIWGKCAEKTGTINYEMVKGFSGSFQGTVIYI